MKAGRFFSLSLIILFLGRTGAFAQHITPINAAADSTMPSEKLSPVIIKAFEESKPLSEQPAAVFSLPATTLNRFGNSGILPAVNTIPGVRMEERSPASYRLNIRGSSLRSPFGVREVKIYYNNIPITDPSGDTYLNQFSFNDFGAIQVIKGPAGSIYGAGIGGVLLINSPLTAAGKDTAVEARAGYTAGSFGRQGITADIQWGDEQARNRISYSGSSSNGYRNHTAMHQQTLAYEAAVQANAKQQFNFLVHYNDLRYQTPGALTLSEFKKDPRASRPSNGAFPSAEGSRAAVHQRNWTGGIDQTYHFTDQLENTTVLYGAYTDFTNPTFRNYEYRKEPHFGGRTVFRYHFQTPHTRTTLLAGAELQQGYFSVKDFGNAGGSPDTLQTEYHINNFRSLIFAQADLAFRHGWDITAGASINFSSLQFTGLYPFPITAFNRKFRDRIIPRMALLKKLGQNITTYASVSRGFSPPTVAELLPSTSVLNTTLQPETGTDFEIGSRGEMLGHKLHYDINGFIFNLAQSISQRKDSSGADYFVNAGGTLQQGAEAYLSYLLTASSFAFVRSLSIWTSQTWSHFRYKQYKVVNADYSGKHLPGVAPYHAVTGLDMATATGITAHITWDYTGRIPLNDANSEYAGSYHLLDLKLAYQFNIAKRYRLDIFAGVNNLLDISYSLGDDINAAGGRYYNAAPGINYFGGISLAAKQ